METNTEINDIVATKTLKGFNKAIYSCSLVKNFVSLIKDQIITKAK